VQFVGVLGAEVDLAIHAVEGDHCYSWRGACTANDRSMLFAGGPLMSVPQRMPSDRPVSASNRVLVHPNLWLLLVALGFGFTTWAAFLRIGIRAQRRSWLAWAAVYGALLVLWIAMAAPTNSTANSIAVVIALIPWIGGTVHAAAIKGNAARRIRPSAGPRLEAARQKIERRTEGKRLAAKDPRLAKEVGVGRPDLPGAEDYGLVDVNHASREALCRLPEITPEIAGRIAETRESGLFESVEDLGIRVDLSPSIVDDIREYVVFL
jgi:DNA uptake protein ComE-like DNA-binding protein